MTARLRDASQCCREFVWICERRITRRSAAEIRNDGRGGFLTCEDAGEHSLVDWNEIRVHVRATARRKRSAPRHQRIFVAITDYDVRAGTQEIAEREQHAAHACGYSVSVAQAARNVRSAASI